MYVQNNALYVLPPSFRKVSEGLAILKFSIVDRMTPPKYAFYDCRNEVKQKPTSISRQGSDVAWNEEYFRQIRTLRTYVRGICWPTISSIAVRRIPKVSNSRLTKWRFMRPTPIYYTFLIWWQITIIAFVYTNSSVRPSARLFVCSPIYRTDPSNECLMTTWAIRKRPIRLYIPKDCSCPLSIYDGGEFKLYLFSTWITRTGRAGVYML